MPTATKFYKYHGLGNDFIVLDRRGDPTMLDPCKVRRLCDRRRGVGADGVLCVLPADDERADLRLLIHNADGSIAETCGNGIRCFVLHALARLPELAGRRVIRVQTGGGLVRSELLALDGVVGDVVVEMGPPIMEAGLVPVTAPLPAQGRVIDAPLKIGEGRTVWVTAVSFGNPHAVIFEGAGPEDAAALGPLLSSHPAFPLGANAGFAALSTDERSIDLAVWERGVGLTEACGSGACAAVVAAVSSGRLPAGSVPVRLPGGELIVEVDSGLSSVSLRGPAQFVFEGVVDTGRMNEPSDGDAPAVEGEGHEPK